MLSYLAHRRACRAKQQERELRIKNLTSYQIPITTRDQDILGQFASEIVQKVQSGALDPQDVLLAYGKKALKAHEETNCLTEVMISEAEGWAKDCNKQGPLAGMPISFKDTVGVAGFDSCIGYSSWVGKPFQKDSPLIRLLRDAGAVPFVKTNVPITLLAFESASDVWGTTTNPHSKGYSPGGSTGGEGAILAYGGSRLGIGTDVAGSVRAPAHFSGIYTIKASSSRFPKAGNASGMIGQEGIPAVYSPMTRTLEDLEYFWKAIVSMKPWEYDQYCAPIPWRDVNLSEKKVKWGVLWDDGIVTPSPACKRALQQVVAALQAEGHEIVTINPPSVAEAMKIGSQLMTNAYITATSHIRFWESNDPGVAQALIPLRLPRFLNTLHAWFWRYIMRDPFYADLIQSWNVKDGQEFYKLIGEREVYRQQWFEYWKSQDLDFIITVPNALPALKHKGGKLGWKSCGYTFLFNVLDYSAGVLPITHVDRALDALSEKLKPRNAIEAGAYAGYDANDMHGLPVGVQVVGRRLEEEKVLEGMKIVEGLLRKAGTAYQLLQK
ncbi:amidase signature enzyme [Dentipellis sp. KUC8613]|nr:amidase signature enzyme [Dentipellis sp. KUC8613]